MAGPRAIAGGAILKLDVRSRRGPSPHCSRFVPKAHQPFPAVAFRGGASCGSRCGPRRLLNAFWKSKMVDPETILVPVGSHEENRGQLGKGDADRRRNCGGRAITPNGSSGAMYDERSVAPKP